MPGFLEHPSLVCADCGHAPYKESTRLNCNPQIRRKITVRCENGSCAQFGRLFDVELVQVAATPTVDRLPSEDLPYGKRA